MKILGVMLLCLLATLVSAQPNQTWQGCRNPVRVFDARAAVNLTPLYQWWTQQPLPTNAADYTAASINIDTNTSASSDRPLPAWHRVTGTHTATLGGSWLVDAVIYTSPSTRTNARIVLNHPPAVEEQTYYTLKTQLLQTIRQLTNTIHEYDADVKAEQQDLKRVQAYRRSLSKVAPTSANNYTRLAAQKHQAAKEADEQKQQLETSLTQIEKQMKGIPAGGGAYRVDWFAAMLGRTKQGLPIYDMGLVSPSPP